MYCSIESRLGRTVRFAWLLLLVITAGCGGGGGGGAPPAPPPPSPPTGLSYQSPQVYPVGGVITALAPAVSGTVTQYGASPALPAGLTLDKTTGQISGTPTTATAASTYTV